MNKKDNKIVIIRNMLLVAFFISQNFFWTLINSIYDGKLWAEKFFPIIQLEGCLFYALFAVYYTGDKEIVKNFLSEKTLLKIFFRFLFNISIVLYIACPKILEEVFGLIFKKGNIKTAISEIKSQIKEYQKEQIDTKSIIVIIMFTCILIMIGYFIPLDYIQIITDFITLLLNVVLFIIILSNVASSVDEIKK